MENSSFGHVALLYLSVAIIAVPLARRLGLGAVIGYLVAGIAIGPWGLRFINDDVEQVLHFAEMGVVFLMFLIGLELNPSKLWQLRRSIFGVGTLQLLFSALLLGGFLSLNLFSWQAALIGGLGLAMSSTAVGLQLMQQKGMSRNAAGQLGFAVLLLQDMAVVPALALVPLLVSSADLSMDWIAISIKITMLAGVVLGGRFLLRPLFHYIAASEVREVFTAAALAVVLGSALLMQELGFSMALGTFLAGVLLAESEFQHELEIAIEPFKGLLLGLFFISIGMALNIGMLFTHLPLVLLGLVVLLVVKSGVLYTLARFSDIRKPMRMQFSVVLSQSGEFAFVLFTAAQGQNLFTPEQSSLLLVIVTLSMMTTPLLMELTDRFLAWRYNRPHEDGELSDIEDDDPQVIVVGFGRFGQVIGRLLMANEMRVTVLERDIEQVAMIRKYGYKSYYGDATRLEMLRAAGAEKAKAIVITCDVPEENMQIVHLCQHYFPKLHILARARGRVEAHELLQAGVVNFTRETFFSSLELGREALVVLGMHPYQALRAQQHFRRLDINMLREFIPPQDGDVVQISRVKEARRELEALFQKEMESEGHRLDEWYELETENVVLDTDKKI